MAETLLSFGVQKLWDLLVRESERFKEVDEQLNELKNDLKLLRSFLKDADAKKHEMETVKSCVQQIKEIVLDAEDIIETFILKEELRKTNGIKKQMRRFSCITVDHRKVASDIVGISKRITKVIQHMQNFGVQQIIVDSGQYSHPLQERQRDMRKMFPSNNENDLVGLEENIKKLVDCLVMDDRRPVVSITGMGGIGKTTLAQQIFNHEMVKNHFDGFAWVCISQQFTRKYVWQTIFQKLSFKNDEQRDLNMSADELQTKVFRMSNLSEDELQEKLFRLLETNKFLIVLDDIWNEEDWDMIKPMFPPNKGWKVLLTSRNERVGLHADPTCVTIKPGCLTYEESSKLFKRIAFPFSKDTAEYKIDVEMDKMSKQMIKHCGGLPLAVKVLGGLLSRRHTLTEWKKVSENIKSHIVGGTSFNDRNISSVYHILYLSYEELPIYLKPCFLYLAHFPEDHKIYVEKLAYYWAAEGIPRPENYESASIRDVADVYIEELVTRNMVISERNMLTSRFVTCQLHDMMRDVCLRKAREENFLHIVPETSTTESESRRLVIHLPAISFNVEREMKNPKLRSLLLIENSLYKKEWIASGLFFRRLRLMRVLDLSYAMFEGGKLPSSIGNLIHLRYLSLDRAEVSHLPSSMRNLKKLFYLNLYVSFGPPIYIPNFFEEMQVLTYLCLPMEIKDKVKMELGSLVNLETLENFSTKNCSVKDLHRMTRLETLSINYNGGCTMENLSSSLRGLNCVRIKELDLNTYMPKLPDEHHFLSSLTTIHLILCFLEEDPMPILENLLQLKEVNLWPDSFCGRRIVCSSSGFPKLQDLSLAGLKEWEEWIVEEGSMPLLHTLTVWKCPKLKQFPDGMRYITSLKRLVIYTDDIDRKKEWKERLSEGGEDYYKVKHIPSVNF